MQRWSRYSCFLQIAPALALLMLGSATRAQQAAWTLKPEWVRAHKEFLASDVLAHLGAAFNELRDPSV